MGAACATAWIMSRCLIVNVTMASDIPCATRTNIWRSGFLGLVHNFQVQEVSVLLAIGDRENLIHAGSLVAAARLSLQSVVHPTKVEPGCRETTPYRGVGSGDTG